MNCETYTQDGVEYVEVDGVRHALGLNPSRYPIKAPAMTQAMILPSREELIRQIESADFEFGQKHFDASWTTDQNGYGKCASAAATSALAKVRYLNGHGRQELSDDYLYSLVNDGRDRGSTLNENMEAISTRGIATRQTVPKGAIYKNKYNTTQANKEALRFRAWECFTTPSFHEVVTCLVNRIPVVIAIHVGRNWQKFDKDGVLIGDQGMGNHCEHCDDVRYNRQKGRFELRKASSHGRQYGEDGYCWIHEGHLKVHSSHEKYGVPGCKDDPLGNNPIGSERDDAPVADAKLIVRSTDNCHWCVKWHREEEQRVREAGIEVIAGDVAGNGVPRFRLEVGGKSADHRGMWYAGEIISKVSDMRS